MGFTQQIITSLLPRSWSESIEAESREWLMRCGCGSEQSVWDAGGIRYKAKGNPVRMVHCAKCNRLTLHQVYRRGHEPPGLADFEGSGESKKPGR